MAMIPYQVRYRMGLRHFFLLIVGAIATLGLFAQSAANKRGLIIDGIFHFSPHSASIFYGVGALLFGVLTFMAALGLLRSLLPPWRLKLTETEVVIPRTYFFGSSKVPYANIKSIKEWSRRGRAHAMTLMTTRGRYVISVAKFPSRNEYETVKRAITGRAGTPGRLPPWKRGTTALPAVKRRGNGAGSFVAWVGGLALMAFGGYYALLAFQAGATPTVVPIGEFENNPPDNRNVIITGGYFDIAHSIKFRQFHGSGDTHPTVTYFVPLIDASPGSANPTPPRVVVKISEFLLNRDKNTLTPGRLHAMRLTHLDFDSDVQAKMRESFGAGVDNMIVVEYGNPPNIYFELMVMAAGAVFVTVRKRFWN